MKSRWFNYRPLCLVFLFLLIGSIFAFYVVSNSIASIIIIVITFAIILLVAILKRKIKYFIIPLISFALGAGCYNLAVSNFSKTIEKQPSLVQARIYRVQETNDNYTRVYADNVTFDGESANSNLIIYIYDDESLYKNIEIGSVISFVPLNFYESELFYYETPNAGYFNENLKYTASVNMESVNYIKTDKTLAELVKERIKENLANGLNNENLEYSYASLFGDKDTLNDNLYGNFKLSGIAHLLAVSGLHVGIIASILTFILNKLKAKRVVKLIVISAFLLIYAYLCNFSVSVIRASIMTIFMLLAPLFYREYDSVSAISFAGIIIFLLNPLTAFDVSFLLSFSCVLGIIMLYKPIKYAVAKTKMPTKITDAFSISLATTTSLIFIMAYYFNNLNIIALLANIILIPIFTFAFMIIFVLAMLSLILPFITYLLFPVNYILNFIALVANILGNLPIANFATISTPYLSMLLYFILIFLLGRFCTADKKYKILLSIPTVAILIISLL